MGFATFISIPLIICVIYITIASITFCKKERRGSRDIVIYDKLVMTSSISVLLQLSVLVFGVVTAQVENRAFTLSFVVSSTFFGAISRCIVQLSVWLQLRMIFRGRGESNRKTMSYVIGNAASITSIVSSSLNLAAHAAKEGLRKKALGWSLPCDTYIMIKMIMTLTNVIDLTTKMTLISLVLMEVLRQKRTNSLRGFEYKDLHKIARRMVVCMALALVNDITMLSVAMMPRVKDRTLRVELMPTVGCINSLGNLFILIISFSSWKERLLPFINYQKQDSIIGDLSMTNVKSKFENKSSTRNYQTEMTSDFVFDKTA